MMVKIMVQLFPSYIDQTSDALEGIDTCYSQLTF